MSAVVFVMTDSAVTDRRYNATLNNQIVGQISPAVAAVHDRRPWRVAWCLGSRSMGSHNYNLNRKAGIFEADGADVTEKSYNRYLTTEPMIGHRHG